MTIRERVRDWLGLIDIEARLKLMGAVLVIPEVQAGRHAEIVNLLSAINKRMINEHIGAPREFVPSELDWETVQTMVMQDLQRKPEKEN